MQRWIPALTVIGFLCGSANGVRAEDKEDKVEAKTEPEAKTVEIPDKNLEKLIREILKKKQREKEKITEEDLETIFFLHGNRRRIESLSGLEHCPNLAEVRLEANRIKDVTPLEKCTNIQSLDLANNRIEDITPLGNLVKLQYLRLDDNRVKKIDAVAKLKAIGALYLDRNRIESLKPLTGLPKLYAIYAARNKLSDLTPVRTVRWLERLDVSGNAIKDVRPLAELTEMRMTFLMQNQISDIAPLVAMSEKDAKGDQRFAPFWNLYLAENPLSDDAKANHVAALKEIGVRVNLEYLRKK